MRDKLTIGVLVGIIVVLVTVLSVAPQHNSSSDSRDVILYRFDKRDIKRLDELVQRHNNGKGDYLMLIPPVVDGGYWIHDVHSNGREITWTIDNTRDGMSAGGKVETYKCRGISKSEKQGFYIYSLENCENQGNKSLPVFSIPSTLQ